MIWEKRAYIEPVRDNSEMENARRVYVLRMGLRAVGDLPTMLESCYQDDPCGSAACVLCHAAYYDHVKSILLSLLWDSQKETGESLHWVTVIPPTGRRELGQLRSTNLASAARWLTRLLNDAGLRDARVFGLWDISYEERYGPEPGPGRSWWEIHWHLLIAPPAGVDPSKAMRRVLRQRRRSPMIQERTRAPVRSEIVSTVKGVTRYLIKANFRKYTKLEYEKVIRLNNNKIPAKRQTELYAFLGKHRINKRLYLRKFKRYGRSLFPAIKDFS